MVKQQDLDLSQRISYQVKLLKANGNKATAQDLAVNQLLTNFFTYYVPTYSNCSTQAASTFKDIHYFNDPRVTLKYSSAVSPLIGAGVEKEDEKSLSSRQDSNA